MCRKWAIVWKFSEDAIGPWTVVNVFETAAAPPGRSESVPVRAESSAGTQRKTSGSHTGSGIEEARVFRH
jgi:hypothetical protein